MEDHRKRKRFEYHDYVLCYKHIVRHRDAPLNPAPIRLQIKDISYGGMRVECNRDLSRGDLLIFNLESNGVLKEYMMEVRWCKYMGGDHEAGLQFTNLTRESILFLDDVIRNHLNKLNRLQSH